MLGFWNNKFFWKYFCTCRKVSNLDSSTGLPESFRIPYISDLKSRLLDQPMRTISFSWLCILPSLCSIFPTFCSLSINELLYCHSKLIKITMSSCKQSKSKMQVTYRHENHVKNNFDIFLGGEGRGRFMQPDIFAITNSVK